MQKFVSIFFLILVIMFFGTTYKFYSSNKNIKDKEFNRNNSPGTTNLTLMNGKETPEVLISNVKDGLYITDMIGSSISMVTGDYSRGASGFWIKNGQLSQPITEATIAGNLKEMFLHMLPANNLDLNSTISAPSILINEMTIAGGSNT